MKARKQRGMVGLMIYKMALDGSRGGFSAAIRMLSSKESVRDAALAAKQWCAGVVSAVRGAADPNPWRNSTDDEIADEIMARIEQGGNQP